MIRFHALVFALALVSCSRPAPQSESTRQSPRKPAPPLFSRAYVNALRGVLSLEPADVEKLEAKLKVQPEDYDARLQLIAYHVRADRVNRPESRQAHLRHVLWLIQNKPDSEILSSPYARLEQPEAREAEVRWLQVLPRYPNDAKVIWNAVCFYRHLDPEKYREYLRKAVELAPDNQHYGRELGLLYASEIITGDQTGAQRELESTKNVAVLESAIRLLHSPKFDNLAEQYFLRAQALDPSTDRALLLPSFPASLEPANAKRPDPGKVIRLLPKDFPELPPEIRLALQARNCVIPQPASDGRAFNVIHGDFFAAGKQSWAILCSAGGSSSILVFRSATDRNPEELAKAKDDIYLMDEAGQTIYSRQIAPVDHKFIVGHYRAYGGPEPPPIDHRGIDDAFLEKASITYYFHKGAWLQLQGAD